MDIMKDTPFNEIGYAGFTDNRDGSYTLEFFAKFKEKGEVDTELGLINVFEKDMWQRVCLDVPKEKGADFIMFCCAAYNNYGRVV